MADEVNGNWDAFDSVTIPEEMLGDVPAATPATPEPEVSPARAAEIAATKDQPAPDAPDQSAPATNSEDQWLPDGSLKLADGTVVSKEEVQRILGEDPAPVETPAPPAEPEKKPDPLLERLEALTKEIAELKAGKDQPAPQQPEQQKWINPIENPSAWIQGRALQLQQQYGADYKPTWAELQSDLALAQNHEIRMQNAKLMEHVQQQEQRAAAAAEQAKLQQRIQQIEASGKYDSLKSAAGQKLLNWFAKDLKPGEDIELAYKGAKDFMPNLVKELYSDKKQEKIRGVLRSLPRGGGTRTGQQSVEKYGADYDSFERLSEDVAKG